MPETITETRSAEMDEILGKPPGALVRYGITIFFSIFALLIIGSWFFKYPDTIQANIEITGQFPPIEVKARSTGRIDTFLIKNNSEVTENQILGFLENPADFNDINRLTQFIDTFDFEHSTDRILFSLNSLKPMQLGELQSSFGALVAMVESLENHRKIDYFNNKIISAQKQLNDYNILYSYTWEQRNTLEKDFQLAATDLERYAKLFAEKVIPEQEFDRAQSNYLAKKLNYDNVRTNLASLKIQISQIKASIQEMEMQERQQYTSLLTTLLEVIENFRAQLDIWQNNYVLISPIQGKCVFTKYWSSNQNVTIGETVCTILPDSVGDIIGTMFIPQSGVGKLKIGQQVNIRLDGYPFMEFGMLQGSVASISAVPEQGVYYAIVTIEEDFISSYGVSIPFQQKLTGYAEVITTDIRLLNRIFRPIKHLLTEWL